jgi:hypothetical protein
MATKAQLKKLQDALKKAEANLAKVQSTVTASRVSDDYAELGPLGGLGAGVIAGVKGNGKLPKPVEPAVAPVNTIEQVGPLGGLSSGAVAGVFAPTGYDASGNPTGMTGTSATGFNSFVAGSSTPPITPVITVPPVPPAPATTASQLIKARLKELKFPDSIIDSSVNFVESLLDDGMELENAVKILYNNKEYTTKAGIKLASPFYAEFTSLGEQYKGDPRFTPTPKDLMEFSLGVKSLVSRYGRSSKFAERTAIEQYVANGVRITDLDERFATAALKTIEADPMEVKTLKALGYIKNTEDLADFYLDPKIGQEQFEINAKTAAFGKQALKRAEYGVTFDAARIKQLAATTGSAAEAEQIAAQGYETISKTLQPLTKLEQIYGVGINQAEIQAQLEEEQFKGTASELRKRRKEQEELSFQRKSGTIGASRTSGGSLGTRSALGTI